MFGMQQMQQDMMQMSLSMQAQARTMQARAAEMQETMWQNAERMRHDSMQMHGQLRHQEESNWARAQHRADRNAENARRHMERAEARMQRHTERMERHSMDRAHRAGHRQQQHSSMHIMNHGRGGGISTVMSNGVLYVNNEPVAHVQPNEGMNMQMMNGVVYLNGAAVWPQPDNRGHRDFEPSAPSPDPIAMAMQYSVPSICNVTRCEEPCPVCLEVINRGDHMRTLPCFHLLHRHCAEAYFSQDSAHGSSPGGPVLCPVCRHVVGPEMVQVDDDGDD